MKTYRQEGDSFEYVAGGTVTVGDFIIQGALTGVAMVSGVSGDHITVVREGVFELPKTTGTAWAQGDRLYWDSNTSKFTTDTTKTPVKAVAFAAAASGDTTGQVLLDEAGGIKFVAGQSTTASASDTIAVPGLSTVYGVVAQLNDAPTDALSWVNADIGDQAGSPAAGSFLLKTWKNTSGSDPTPLAATSFGAKINWVAWGK